MADIHDDIPRGDEVEAVSFLAHLAGDGRCPSTGDFLDGDYESKRLEVP